MCFVAGIACNYRRSFFFGFMMNIGLKNMQGGLNHHFLNEVKFNLEYCCDPWDFQGVYDKLSSQQYGKKPSRGCPIIILLIPLA